MPVSYIIPKKPGTNCALWGIGFHVYLLIDMWGSCKT